MRRGQAGRNAAPPQLEASLDEYLRATGVGHERGNRRAITRLDVGKICPTIGCAMAVLIAGRFAMVSAAQSGMVFLAGMLMAGLPTAACAQQPQYPNPADLPNPYLLLDDWPTLPPSMNSGRRGEATRAHFPSDVTILILHLCYIHLLP